MTYSLTALLERHLDVIVVLSIALIIGSTHLLQTLNTTREAPT